MAQGKRKAYKRAPHHFRPTNTLFTKKNSVLFIDPLIALYLQYLMTHIFLLCLITPHLKCMLLPHPSPPGRTGLIHETGWKTTEIQKVTTSFMDSVV